jgi:hypothetical protein
MPENNIVKLPIDQVYTVLKKEHLTNKEKDSSLSEKNNAELLVLINEELKSSELLMRQLNSDIHKGLINPEFKHVADKFVKETNNTLTVESSAIKQQLDKFIYFSELLFLILTKASLLDKLTNRTTLKDFAFLTKLKFNLFLDNLNRFLIETKEENSELVRITQILIKDYFPAVAVADYDTSTQCILNLYNTNVAALKDAIENKDIPSLQKSLDTYQKNISGHQSEYYDCSDELLVNNTRDLNQSHDSDRCSYVSCETEDEKENFFDAVDHLTDQSLSSKEQSNTSNQGLLQRLINWFRKLIYSHILHRTRETPPSTGLSGGGNIESLIDKRTGTASSTSSIASENSAHTPISISIPPPPCKRKAASSSTNDYPCFFSHLPRMNGPLTKFFLKLHSK